MDAQRVQRQHRSGLGHEPPLIRGGHHHVQPLTAAGLDLHVDRALSGQRKILGCSRFGLRKRLTRHHQPAAPDQLLDQGRLPFAPHPRPGGLGVGFGERVQHFEQQRIAAERFRHALNGFGVVQVAAGRHDRQQQVVADQLRERLGVGGRDPQSRPDIQGQARAEHAVVDAAALADVVQQRAERE